jgi:DNA-binding transcriptional regulator YdaS (Cro superfamily)
MKLYDYIKTHPLPDRQVRNFIAAVCNLDAETIKFWQKHPKKIEPKYYAAIEKATLGHVTVDELANK